MHRKTTNKPYSEYEMMMLREGWNPRCALIERFEGSRTLGQRVRPFVAICVAVFSGAVVSLGRIL